MLDLRIITDRGQLSVTELRLALGPQQAAKEIGDAIEALITTLDDMAGDCDLEEETDYCLAMDDRGTNVVSTVRMGYGSDYGRDDEDGEPGHIGLLRPHRDRVRRDKCERGRHGYGFVFRRQPTVPSRRALLKRRHPHTKGRKHR